MGWLRQIRYLTLRSIQARSRRFILSGFGIVLGVATILAISITNQAAMSSIEELFQSTSGKTKLTINSASGDEIGFSEEIQQIVENFPDIEVAAPGIQVFTVLADDVPSGELTFGLFGTSTQGLQLNGIDPELDPLLRDYTLTEGEFFDVYSTKREVILVKEYAEDQSLSVGDWLAILTPNGAVEIRVLGLMEKEGPGQTNNGAFGIIPLSVGQELFNRKGDLDQLDILTTEANPSIKELEILQTALQDRLGDDLSVTFPSAQGKRMVKMLQSYQIGLNFMSGIALFVGAFLIYNAFAMTVIERTREFGMLRTVGMTRRQVSGLVFLEAGVLGIIGSSLGIVLGVGLANGMTRIMELVINQDLLISSIPLSNYISSWSIGVAVTLVAAGLPAWQAGKISPMEALQVRSKSEEGWLIIHGWKVGIALLIVSTSLLIANPFPYDVQFRLGTLTVFGLFGGATLLIPSTVGKWEKISRPALELTFGSSGNLGSRNVQRSRQRTTLTVAAMMVGVAMVIITRGMTSSFSVDLKDWINAYIGGDIYASSAIPIRGEIARRLQTVPGVQAVAPVRYLNIKWQQPDGVVDDIYFMAIDPTTYTKVTQVVFSDEDLDAYEALVQLNRGGGVFISTVLAEKHGIAPGDTVKLRTRSGLKEFDVIAVVVDFYNQGMVIQGSWKDMRRYFKIDDASTLFIKVEPSFSVPSVLTNIDLLYGDRYRLTLEENEAIQSRIQVLMDRSFGMFDVMALISIVVGALGIVNTLTISVIERTKEIGMLRAIGMTRAQIIRMVLAEASLMGIIGGLLGLVTGIILARIIFIGMTTMSGYQLTFSLPPVGVVISLISALFISIVAAIFPARRAARIGILEAVHYE